MINNKLVLSILFATLVFFTACSDDDDTTEPITEPTSNTIVDIAQNDDNFSTLVAALTRADLVETLNGSTEYTVFAPTNQAFDDLLDELGIESLDAVSDEELTNILLNHVVAGKVMSTDLTTGYVNTAATGPNDNAISLFVDLTDGVELNNRATVSTPDIDADNGVVHVINKVLLVPNAVDAAVANPALSSLVAALTADGLPTNFVDALSADGPFTIFAPDNDAFTALLDGNEDWNELGDIPVETLDAVLKYHVISGSNVTSSDIVDGSMPATLEGSTVTLNLVDGNATVTDANENVANVELVDIQTSNGVIHVINKVILP